MTWDKFRYRLFSNPLLNRLLGLALLAIAGFLAVGTIHLIGQSSPYRQLQEFAFWLGESYERWFNQQQTGNPLVLLGLAFVGGLAASISPCILSLLPVNLSYIGTRQITSRRDAFQKASAFVLGVVLILSILGLFSSLAGIVLIKFRGYFHVAVGGLVVLMGLSLSGLIHLPLPQFLAGAIAPDVTSSPQSSTAWKLWVKRLLLSPFGAGVTFALVSSPCTSPVMFAVLAAAAATGSSLQSALVMVCYALGYTAIIFLASLFTGLTKQTRWLLQWSDSLTKIASVILVLVGSVYIINGGRWIWAALTL